MNSATSSAPSLSGPWWRELNGYHWFVFLIAAFGWMFDCFDQQIFTMSRSITMRDLMPVADTLTQIKYGGWATSIFIVGWATGGLIFGTLGDRWGRAKTMALTILVYAACTGWSGLYYLGAFPALIAVFVFARLREPERWVAAKAAAVRTQTTKHLGSLSDLFTNAKWRRNTLAGLGLAIAGQIGLWGVGFYTPELIDNAIATIEPATRPKVEAALKADSVAAHTAAVNALDEKEKRKYAELVSRATPQAGAKEGQT